MVHISPVNPNNPYSIHGWGGPTHSCLPRQATPLGPLCPPERLFRRLLSPRSKAEQGCASSSAQGFAIGWGGGGIFSRNARPLRISFVLGGLLLVAARPAGSTQFIVLARSKQCSWAFPVLQFRRCTQHHQQPPPSSRASSI